jgi:hypothetical protein
MYQVLVAIKSGHYIERELLRAYLLRSLDLDPSSLSAEGLLDRFRLLPRKSVNMSNANSDYATTYDLSSPRELLRGSFFTSSSSSAADPPFSLLDR